jgi:hypothetical protein
MMKACTFGMPATCTRNACRAIPTANSPKPIRLNDASRFPCSDPIFLRSEGFLCRPRLVVRLAGLGSLRTSLFKDVAAENGLKVPGSSLIGTEFSAVFVVIPHPLPRIVKTHVQANSMIFPLATASETPSRIAEASLFVRRGPAVDGLHEKRLSVVYDIFRRDKSLRMVHCGMIRLVAAVLASGADTCRVAWSAILGQQCGFCRAHAGYRGSMRAP